MKRISTVAICIALGVSAAPFAVHAYGQAYYEGGYYAEGYYQGTYYTQSYYQASYGGSSITCDGTSRSYSGGTYTVPAYGAMSVTVIGAGGGGGGGSHPDDGTTGGAGGAGAASSIVGSFGTISASGGAGGSVGRGWGAAGATGSTATQNVTPTVGETFTIVVGGGGGGGGGGGINGYGRAGGNGSAGTPAGGTGGTGGNVCYWQGAGHSGPSISGGEGGVSSGGGGGGGAAADNGSFGCNAGQNGGSGSLNSGGTGGANAQYTYYPPAVPGGATPGFGGSAAYDHGGGGGGGAGQVSISCTANQAPTAPTVSGDTSPQMDSSYTYSFVSTDPNSDTIRYGIDWDNDGTVDEYAPALGYAASGASTSTTHSWNSTGSKTFKVRAADPYGNTSGWTSYSVTVSYPTPVVLLTASPSSITTGQSSTLTWSSSYATSCSGTHFSTGDDVSGSVSVSPTVTTSYTVSCTGAGGTGSSSKTVTYSCTPSNICSSGNVVNSCTGALVQSCSYGCGGGSCALPPAPSFSSFSDGDGNSYSGHIQIRPSLVRSGQSTKVYWSVANAASCAVSGSNGDSWTGASSGTAGKATAAINQRITYTLSCTGLDDSTLSESAAVNVTPTFFEL